MIVGRPPRSSLPSIAAPRPGWSRLFRAAVFRIGAVSMLCLCPGPGRHCPAGEVEADPTPGTTGAEAGKPAGDSAEAYRFGGADAAKVGQLPDFTRGLSYKAAVAFGEGDWKTAKAAYREILEEHPDNALVLTNLAAVEHRTGELPSALAHLDRAVAINPAIPQAWILKGLIHYEDGDRNLAVSSLTRALHEDPLDPRPHNYLGVVLRDLGWLHGAEQELRRAIELDPAYADAHFNLALLFLDRVPPARELARRHYEKALELGSRPDKLAERKIAGDGGGGD